VKKPPARKSTRSKRSTAAAKTSPATHARARKKKATARRHAAKPVEAVPVTAADLRRLQRELAKRMAKGSGARAARTKGAPLRWNPDPEDVQKSVAQLVLTIVEFLRKLMERQAVRRMEANTLTPEEVEAVGTALMRLEETVRDLGRRFGLEADDLNLDLGPIKLM